MSLLNPEFNGLSDEDFEVYQPHCWSNNRFNLDRMRTKERVQHLAQAMVDALELDGVRLEASSEIPSVWNGREVKEQWVFLVRDDDARRHLQPVLARRLDLATRIKAPADHLKHIFIGLRLDAEVLEISLRLSQYAMVDIENTMGRAEAEPDDFRSIIDALSDVIRLDGNELSAGSFMTAVRALQEGSREWLTLGCSLKRADVTQQGSDLLTTIGQVSGELGAIFRFCSWTEKNDHVGVDTQLSAVAEAQQSADDERQAHRERKAALHAERAEKARERTSSKVAAEDAWREMQARRRAHAREVEAPVGETDRSSQTRQKGGGDSANRRTTPGRSQRFERPSKGPSSSRAKRPTQAPSTDGKRPAKRSKRKEAPVFNSGDKCRLTRGIFAGKEGEVTGGGKPGYYAVKVGILEVNVSAYDLEKITD